ncbi:MAG: DUF1080 domain-containing protein [Cyclobacteriaceae bacterium]
MRYLSSLLFLILPFLFICCSTEQQGEEASQPLVSEEWKRLIKDDGLDGWTALGSVRASRHEDELMLTRSGDTGGWLVSDASPSDFVLRTEFKLSPNASSGVAIRFPAQQGGDPAYSGFNIKLDHQPDIQNPTGSIVYLARAFWNEKIDSLGWNRLEIHAEGDHLKVMINDQKVAETFSRRSMAGAIALQAPAGDENAEVRFRNLELRSLPSGPFTQPMIADYMRSMPKRDREFVFNGQNTEGWLARGDAQWTVSEGVISGNSEGTPGGYLCTDDIYKNFYLRLKFRIALEDNSGVFLRLNPEAEEVSLSEGLEVNVYDVADLAWAHPTGSINTHARAFTGMVDYEDWNLMEIFAFNEQVTVYVNGMKASEAQVPEAYQQPGQICLQVFPRVATDGGPSRVMYKDVALKNMEGIPFIGY